MEDEIEETYNQKGLYFGRALVFLLGSCGIVSSVFCTRSCELFAYRTLDGKPWEGFASPPFDTAVEASVGLFRYNAIEEREIRITTIDANSAAAPVTTTSFEKEPVLNGAAKDSVLFGEACIDYDAWQEIGEDSKGFFQIGQWCGMGAPGLAFLALLFVLFDCCCCIVPASDCLASTLFFLAAIAQLFTFAVFADTEFCFEADSTNQCRLGLGAFYSIGSAGVYLFLCLLVCSSAQPDPLLGDYCYDFCSRGANDDEEDDNDDHEEHRGRSRTRSRKNTLPSKKNDPGDTDCEEGGSSGDDVEVGSNHSPWAVIEGDESMTVIPSQDNEPNPAPAKGKKVEKSIKVKAEDTTKNDTTNKTASLVVEKKQRGDEKNRTEEKAITTKKRATVSTKEAIPESDLLDLCCGDPLQVDVMLNESNIEPYDSKKRQSKEPRAKAETKGSAKKEPVVEQRETTVVNETFSPPPEEEPNEEKATPETDTS